MTHRRKNKRSRTKQGSKSSEEDTPHKKQVKIDSTPQSRQGKIDSFFENANLTDLSMREESTSTDHLMK